MSSNKWIWKETAEVIGVLGVIGSLIIVAMEIGQNTDATRSAAVQAIAQQSISLNALVIENADLRLALARARDGGMDALDSDQALQLRIFYSATLRIQQNRYQLIDLDIYDDEDVYATRLGSGYCEAPFLQYWDEARESHARDFVEWFDSELKKCER